jgi:hypothetical protein
VTNRYDVLFAASQFNLSERRDYFVNDCCYGDDTARWLRHKLVRFGMHVTEPRQEDWGWYIKVQHGRSAYFFGIGGNAEGPTSGNEGEWRVMVEKRRSFTDKLVGKNQMAENEEILAVLIRLIENEPDMKFLRIE